MADPSSIHTSESLPFAAMYHLQTQSQRSNCSISQNSSSNRLSQYEESSNLICDPTDNCTTAGTSMNGVNVQIGSGYWEPESLVLPPSVALNRIKASSEGYGGEWNYNLHQQIAVDNCGPTEGNRQKLDSFSDAFHGRGISRITNSGEQIGYNVQPNNFPHANSFPSLSLPLVLSPPPTPLPPPSLSPPKRPSQSQNQTQSQSHSEGSLRFFPPPSCTGSILPGSFPPTHWLYLPTDASGNTDIMQQLPQDTSPSSVYPEGVEISLRQLSATDTDTSSCSPLTQHQPPISIPKLKQEHDAVTSEHHMTWSQMMQTSQPFSPHHHSHALAEQLEAHEDTKPTSGFQQPRCLYLSGSQNTPSTVYTGVPFHSVLQSGVLGEHLEQQSHHYTPPPMLNPTRSGTGLFCNLLPPMDRDIWSEEIGHNACHRHVNIGPEFQAKLPDMHEKDQLHTWAEEPLHEELLWKPWVELEESDILLERVENLLDLSTSAALPGSAANLELALHSLSLCQGNILAALERMLFSDSTPSRDYHYAGSDVWELSEQKLFHKAFALYGKDFTFIQKMVKTKQVSECVEFYYHTKWRQEKQRKQMEKQQQQMDAKTPTNHVLIPAPKITMNPISVERLIHTPSMAPSFPCKQCGKMFYKIKSRNAHMKIHRQQQEDWRERIHPNNPLSLAQALQNQTRTLTHPNQLITQNYPNQMLTQNLIQNLVQSHSQLAFIQSNKTQSTCFSNSISNTSPTQNSQTASKTPNLPLYTGYQQTWGSLHGSLESGLYYD